ncbi:oligomeric Golgi complex subunit 6 [Tothia fuscella]|uniref:Conserved oligomeric Golgi complex subunit 6 n=1 Tax=Tothia fuscella TaxID=1048955 RepID=A0A9P4TVV4_9PEZI|nr:oligomeric Golgi complex subunit 6 [Tothia fuscella]
MSSSYFHGRNGSTDLASPSATSPSTSIGTAPRSSALSSRITSVLSASYADLDIRDALETLDKRGFQNTQESRRNLRLDLQQEVIQCNGEIVRDFGQVAQQLKRIGAVVDSLNKCCDDMRTHISASKREVGPVLEEANSLMQQKSQVESKQHILDAFKKHFVVSDTEIAILTSSSEPVNDDFFRVLVKVKKIHQDSEILLGNENERLGLEILEQSSKQLNSAFQKLYRWIQKEFKTLDLENPQISSSIRRSLRVLAERPALFQSCMDFFAEAREHTLSDCFFAALTGSATDSDAMPHSRPIEFQAHDPLRFVGDMLAWAHSATVSEREALEVLFIGEGDELAKGIQAGLDADIWSKGEGAEEAYDGRKALNELVGRDIAGVARLLRQRTEQVISSHEDATLAYKIANLIGFYKNTFGKLIGSEAAILEILDGLETYAQKQFRANMRDHVASVQAELSIAPADLSAPDFLLDALETLKTLIKSYGTSLAAADEDSDAFDPVFTEALDPFLKACETLEKKMVAPHGDIFAINCLLTTKTALTPFPFAAEKITAMDDSRADHIVKLTTYQYNFFLKSSGLEPLVTTLATLENISTIPSLPLFQENSLIRISQTLDDFLPSAHMDAMDNIKKLQSPQLTRDITEAAAERFCEDFEMVEEKLLEADDLIDGREEDGDGEVMEERIRMRDMFPRTGGEIRVLLT